MKYQLTEGGIVVQVQPNPDEGFIECPSSVHCGMLFDGVNYSQPAPPAQPTAEEIILEKQAAFEERVANDFIYNFMFDELATLKGTSRAAEHASAKARIV